MPESNEMLSVGAQLVGMPLAGPESFTAEQVEYLKKAMGLDETVLYDNPNGLLLKNGLVLPETLYNFERIMFYVDSCQTGGTPAIAFVPIQIPPYNGGTFALFFTNGHDLTSNFKLNWKWKLTLSGTTLTLTLSQFWGQNGTNWSQGDNLNDARVFKIVGIHRISGGN